MASERLEIKTLEEAFKIVNDAELKEIYEFYLKEFSKEPKFSGIYSSKEEVADGLKERIVDALSEKYNEFKTRISFLRKKGFDINMIEVKLDFFPSKLIFLQADFNKEAYEMVMRILNKTSAALEQWKNVE